MDRLARTALALVAVVAAACGSGGGEPAPAGPSVPPPVGAAYYSWFPERWAAGTSGQRVAPPVLPVLGEYASSPATLAVHAAAAEDALDLLVLDVWPSDTGDPLADAIWRRVLAYYRTSPPLGGMRTALLYELQALIDPTGRGRFELDPSGEERLVADLAELAELAFPHPSYMRIDGRPVLFLYLTRQFEGDLASALGRVRAALRERHGELYLVGDEVYWQVVGADGELLPPQVPNRRRLRAFDAIFGYAPVLTVERYCGPAGIERFVEETAAMARRYARIAAEEGVAYVPTVMPAFNDRGARPDLAHCTIPAEDGAGLFLERSWRDWAEPFLGAAPLVFATSFNEWNEGTQLEPARGEGGAHPFFTEGVELEGAGRRLLDVLARLSAAPPADD